jgi:hypothetical protein
MRTMQGLVWFDHLLSVADIPRKVLPLFSLSKGNRTGTLRISIVWKRSRASMAMLAFYIV